MEAATCLVKTQDKVIIHCHSQACIKTAYPGVSPFGDKGGRMVEGHFMPDIAPHPAGLQQKKGGIPLESDHVAMEHVG